MTDFTQLNKLVIRPVHPFMSREEILSTLTVTPISLCYGRCEGVFSDWMDEESSLLTTILLPQVDSDISKHQWG